MPFLWKTKIEATYHFTQPTFWSTAFQERKVEVRDKRYVIKKDGNWISISKHRSFFGFPFSTMEENLIEAKGRLLEHNDSIDLKLVFKLNNGQGFLLVAGWWLILIASILYMYHAQLFFWYIPVLLLGIAILFNYYVMHLSRRFRASFEKDIAYF